MSTKRQPSKQRRQTQNQRQRAALEARRANAAAGPAPTGKVGGDAPSASRPAGGGGSLFSRLRGSAATGRAVRTGQPAGTQPIGYRAALTALLASLVAVVIAAFFTPVAVDATGDQITTPGAMVGEWTASALEEVQQNPDGTADEIVEAIDDWTPNGTEPYGKANFPLSLGLLLPVVGAALAFRAVSRRAGAKVVNRAMYVTLFGTLFNLPLLLVFLPTIVGIGIAAFQVRKAEIEAAAAEAADGGASGDDDVIEVDEVDDHDDDDDDDDRDDDVEDDELAEDDAFLDAEDAADEDDDDEEPAAPGSVLGRLRRPTQRNV